MKTIILSSCTLILLSLFILTSVNATGAHLATPTILLGDIEEVRASLDEGADVNAKGDNGIAPLILASTEGHTEIVKLLLARGANIKAKVGNGFTALMCAAGEGHTETVEVLLANGADVNAKTGNGTTALMIALKQGQTEVVKLLEDWHSNTNSTESKGLVATTSPIITHADQSFLDNLKLTEAASAGDTETVKVLLMKGVDVNVARGKDDRTALMLASFQGYNETVKTLLNKGADVNTENKKSQTALEFAALQDHHETVKILLDRGASIDSINSALRAVSLLGYTKMVLLLLDRGADVNARGENGDTALHYATTFGTVETVKVLLDRGADCNITNDKGETPLVCAAGIFGDKEIAKLLKKSGAKKTASTQLNKTLIIQSAAGNTEEVVSLLECGVDVNVRMEGYTALFVASAYGHAGTVKALLKGGANINAKNDDGRTALSEASRRGHTEIVNLLKKWNTSAKTTSSVIATFSGTGSRSVRPFFAAGPWEAQWDAKGVLFNIYLYTATGKTVGVIASQRGPGKGATYRPKGGKYYFEIDAMDKWDIRVVTVE